ncbi:chemotaxis protein CheD [Acidisoma silvae]|uniref:Probable chemoreceptor glutamine deamidase CheD n=1 Tax=Acidisoma silvae TaxID=2802396 RepID=A0A963YQH9_9PROT|nr:chemotaxis protein CheD [Acidisoma silvae]MCB8874941.1 chemotaxis protein CheD [Acidisoma silvae]
MTGASRIHVVQGEQHVSNHPDAMLTTILGSCIAACLWDPVSGYGGMNHFLLPGVDSRPPDARDAGPSARYGAHAMELLVNALLAAGARRQNLRAKLFGGARMIQGLTDIGHLNADFAETFLRTEGITFDGGSLRGQFGRRVQFWPASGKARQVLLQGDSRPMFEDERRAATLPPDRRAGAVALF